MTDTVRLQFDDFSLHYDSNYGSTKQTGWSLYREGRTVLSFVTWDVLWATMSTGERVRCIVFGNRMR